MLWYIIKFCSRRGEIISLPVSSSSSLFHVVWWGFRFRVFPHRCHAGLREAGMEYGTHLGGRAYLGEGLPGGGLTWSHLAWSGTFIEDVFWMLQGGRGGSDFVCLCIGREGERGSRREGEIWASVFVEVGYNKGHKSKGVDYPELSTSEFWVWIEFGVLQDENLGF